MKYNLILKTNTKGLEFKIVVDDAVSRWFRDVIKHQHYFYNPALLHLQSIDQGREWKEMIQYPIPVDCSFLTKMVYVKDRYSKEFEPLETEFLQLLYVPKTNLFTLMNFGDSSYEFDFLFFDDIQRNF